MSIKTAFCVLLGLITGCTSALAQAPSFNCAKATYPDERAICSNAELSQLDNVANAGYEYVRRVYGTQYSKSVTLPLLHARQACGSNIVCIKEQQLAAIQKFQSLGAPVNGPQISQPQQGSASALPSQGQQQTDDLGSMIKSVVDRQFDRCLLREGKNGSYSSFDGGKSAVILFFVACKNEYLAYCKAHPEWPDAGPNNCKVYAAIQAQMALKLLDK